MPKALPLLDDLSPICCVPLASTPIFPADDAVRLAIRLKALADPTRLQLIAFMLSQPGREACTCDLAPVVGLTESTVSHHLKTLEKAGLVTKERRGMNVHYAVESVALRALGRAIHLDELGTPALSRPACV
jgi:ArsR family transcriptional regulator